MTAMLQFEPSREVSATSPLSALQYGSKLLSAPRCGAPAAAIPATPALPATIVNPAPVARR